MSINFLLSKVLSKALKTVFFGASFLVLGFQLQAQDLFFNQYLYAPLATNPAQTGTFEGSWISVNYRNTPLTSGVNINTNQISGIHSVPLGDLRLVLSGSFYSDKISESFTTNGGIFGTTISLPLSLRSELNFGTQASFFGTSINEDFTTDSQFVNGIFNPASPTGEFAGFSPGNHLSVSSGLYWQLRGAHENVKAFAGIALFNLTQPNVAVSDLETDELPITYKATLGYEILRQQNFAISPSVLGISRSGQQWLQAGGLLTYDVAQDAEGIKQIGVGAWYNTTKAVQFSVQYKQPNMVLALNFDLPSGDGFAAARKETFEIALNYRIFKKKKRKSKTKTTKKSKVKTEVPAVESTNTQTTIETEKPEPSPENTPQDTVTQRTNEAQQIKEATPEALPTMSAQEEKILGKHVSFRLNSEMLTNASQAHLDQIASILKKYSHYNITLTGHTCSLGKDEINKVLSLLRADKVKEYLLQRGLDSRRIETVGQGETQPLVENTNEAARLKNRRVEIKIASKHDSK